ncbi:MAG: hypothetical protein LBU22_03300 [Dysgonamonadaceae bacterium]|jgi:hypothetical protein|nr:hypothetical protein [Dysgonamonadaceae bacterium]
MNKISNWFTPLDLVGLGLFVLCLVYPTFFSVVAFCLFICIQHFFNWYRIVQGKKNAFELLTYKNRTATYGIFLTVACFWLAFGIGSKYSPFSFYSNTQVYSLAQKGFEYTDRLNLVSDNLGSAVWEDEVGELFLQGNSIQGSNFLKPVYSDEHQGNVFHLKNPVFTQGIRNHFAIEKINNNETDTLIAIEINKTPKKFLGLAIKKDVFEYEYRISNGAENYTLNSDLGIVIKRGIRISDLVEKCDSLFLSDDALAILDNAWLLRSAFNPAYPNPDADLLFYPGENFILNSNQLRLTIDEEIIPNQSTIPNINVPLQQGERFFTGVAGNYRSLIYRYEQGDSGHKIIVHFGPKFHFKEGNKDKNFSVLVTNSEDHLLDADTRNAFYLGALSNPNSAYYYNGTINYTIGTSFEPLRINWSDRNNPDNNVSGKAIESKETFALSTNDSRVKCLFEITDLRSTNGLGINTVLFVILFTGILILLINAIPSRLFKKKNQSSLRTETVQIFEAPFLFILLTLISIRFILQWRAGVFAPLSGISENHFALLRQSTVGSLSHIGFLYRYSTSILLLLFFLVIYLLCKIYQLPKIIEKIVPKIAKSTHWNFWLVFQILSIFAAWSYRTPTTIILIPISVFLLTALYFKYTYSRPNPEQEKQLAKSTAQIHVQWFLVLFSLLGDMGFAFIFLLSSITYYVLCNVARWYDYLDEKWKKLPHRLTVISLLVLIIVPAFLIVFWNLTSRIKDLSIMVICYVIFIVFPLVYFFCYNVYKCRNEKVKKKVKTRMLIIAAVFSSLVVLGMFYKSDKVNDLMRNTHFRSLLIKEKVSDMIEDIDNNRDAASFFNSAHNQWLINTYSHKSPMVSTMDVKPHTGIGSNYVTQANDLISIRYVISEHGWMVGIFLWLLLLIPLFSRIYFNFDKRQQLPYYEKSTQLNTFMNIDLFVLILVFMLAFVVWLSATNRFIFIGQDFPFIVFNSGASLCYLLIFFFIALWTKSSDQKYIYSELSSVQKHSPKWRRLFFISVLIVALGSCMSIIRFINPNKSDATDLGMSDFVEKTERVIDELNDRFVPFQEDNRSLRNLDSLVIHFDSYLKEQPDTMEYIPSYLNNEYQKFLQIKNKANSSNFIYLKRKSGIYLLTLNERFYNLSSPFDNKKYWKGDLLDKNGAILARYMWVNGKNRHVYPRKENLIWAYNMTEYIRSNVKKQSDQNLNVTLDMALQDAIGGMLNRTYAGLNTEQMNRPADRRFYLQLDRFQNLNYAAKTSRNNSHLQLIETNGIFSVTGSTYSKINSINTKLQKFGYQLRQYYRAKNYVALNNRINSLIEEAMYNDNFVNLVVLDGNGNVRIMMDHGKNRKFNPNRLAASYNYIDEIINMGNSGTERKKFGDRSLLINNNPGNGSTTKPIMYTAMTSQYDFPGGWGNLIVQNGVDNSNAKYDANNINYVENYAGRRIKAKWKIPHYSSNAHYTPVTYLTKSSNLYNSVMLFLGSFTPLELDNYNFQRNPVRNTWKFPELRIGNSTCYLDSVHWPGVNDSLFNNQQSILATGLRTNYGILTDNKETFPSRKINITHADFLQKKGKRNYSTTGWILPEQATFYQQDRAKSFRDAIANPTSGGSPIRISPMDMAVYCARTLTLNKDFVPSFFENDNLSYSKFESAWNGFAKYHRDTIVYALNRIFYDGTFRGIRGSVFMDNQTAKIRNNDGQVFFIYGKSGTSADMENSRFGDDHLAIFLISNQDLSGAEREPENAKFYTVFLNVSWSNYGEIRSHILTQIINSQLFNEYMNQ